MKATEPEFAVNLREACSTRASISQVCREVAINRQQFNRYINGQALPSVHNRRRIASLFGLQPEHFTLPLDRFRQKLAASRPTEAAGNVLMDGYPGDGEGLARYLGFYQTYHMSLSWPGFVVCSCAHLKERDGLVMVTSRERITDAERGIRQRSRYVGLAALWRNRIFVTERTLGDQSTFGQTILMPFEVHQRMFLHGITTGVSWRNENAPYASRMIWRFMGRDADRRALLQRCGLVRRGSGDLPAPVLRYLGGPDAALVTI